MSEQDMATAFLQDEETEMPYVVFEVAQNKYAFLCTHISYITQLPEVTPVPEAPPYLRGISVINGEVIPMVDARAYFQLQTLREELCVFESMIDQREQDHRNWLASFKQSVEAQTEITVNSNPRTCAFGRWYYSYQPKNAWVSYQLKKIEEPHCRLHKSVDLLHRCAADTEAGRQQAAEILREAECELMPTILSALGDCKRAVRSGAREMTLILTGQAGEKVGLVVDAVECVEMLEEDLDTQTMQTLQQGRYIEGIKLYKEQTVLMLGELLLNELAGLAARVA